MATKTAVKGNGSATRGRLGQTKTAAPAAPVEEQGAALQIDTIGAETLLVPIVGTSPLIVHRFSEKARRQMLDAMQGRKTLKTAKDPQAEYEAAFYRLKDGTAGFPAAAFRQATVSAARFYGSGVKMTDLRASIFMRGELGTDGTSLVGLETSEPWMREDVVRVNRGGTDLRYRPQFDDWRTTLQVVYVPSMLTQGSVLSLINAGGLGIGVGEWRPEKDGDFGTYTVDTDRDVRRISQ